MVFLRQIQRMRVVAGLAADLDGRGQIKVEMVVGVEETRQLALVLQLGVAVQQQRGVVFVGQVLHVQRLQVAGQVQHARRVEKRANHVTRL